jgi:hypothetical protein
VTGLAWVGLKLAGHAALGTASGVKQHAVVEGQLQGATAVVTLQTGACAGPWDRDHLSSTRQVSSFLCVHFQAVGMRVATRHRRHTTAAPHQLAVFEQHRSLLSMDVDDQSTILLSSLQSTGKAPFIRAAGRVFAAKCFQSLRCRWLTDESRAGLNTLPASSSSGYRSCSLLAADEADAPTAAAYFTVLRRRVAEQLQHSTRSAALQVLKAGVQCLEGFVQLNLCG